MIDELFALPINGAELKQGVSVVRPDVHRRRRHEATQSLQRSVVSDVAALTLAAGRAASGLQ